MIFIPDKIHVGFNKRKDVVNGLLGYVTYYDGKGVLHKKDSLDCWRDNDIPTEDYDNLPTSGFIIEKKVGEDRYCWNPRRAWIRITDPRGFDLEISVDNLIYILKYCQCDRGQIIGDLVYCFDKGNLALFPTNSIDYKEVCENSSAIKNGSFSSSQLVEGHTYLNKRNELVVYLGRHDTLSLTNHFNGEFSRDEYKLLDKCRDMIRKGELHYNRTYLDNYELSRDFIDQVYINSGKSYYFGIIPPKDRRLYFGDKVYKINSVSSHIIKEVNIDLSKEDYDMLKNYMTSMSCFGKLTKTEVEYMTEEDLDSMLGRRYYYGMWTKFTCENLTEIYIKDNGNGQRVVPKSERRYSVNTKTGYVGYMDFDNLQDIIKMFKILKRVVKKTPNNKFYSIVYHD